MYICNYFFIFRPPFFRDKIWNDVAHCDFLPTKTSFFSLIKYKTKTFQKNDYLRAPTKCKYLFFIFSKDLTREYYRKKLFSFFFARSKLSTTNFTFQYAANYDTEKAFPSIVRSSLRFERILSISCWMSCWQIVYWSSLKFNEWKFM